MMKLFSKKPKYQVNDWLFVQNSEVEGLLIEYRVLEIWNSPQGEIYYRVSREAPEEMPPSAWKEADITWWMKEEKFVGMVPPRDRKPKTNKKGKLVLFSKEEK